MKKAALERPLIARMIDLQGTKETVAAVEVLPFKSEAGGSFSPACCVILLPGTSIRPGPGADKSAKYAFGPEVRGIYRDVAHELASTHGIPSVQLCWRRFPSDGGTTADAVHDMIAALHHIYSAFLPQCGAFFVGYSFGGAAIWALLARCFNKPELAGKVCGGGRRSAWLLGCIALSGALKGGGDDTVNLFGALRFLDQSHAPLLIVHGSEDDNVAFSAAQKLYRQSPAKKSLCVLEGADHNLRDPHWVKLAAGICSRWLSCVARSRGSRGLGLKLAARAHDAAAVWVIEYCGSGGSRVSFAFDPQPKGVAYRNFDVSAPLEAFVPLPSGATAGKGARTSSEDITRGALLMAGRCSGHVERQRKARERQRLERTGNLPTVLERLRQSRSRAISEALRDLTDITSARDLASAHGFKRQSSLDILL
eukprot:TRINITY_DN48956_c0_g1_i1.p1 TRINITY_DN48956_c0_g1~~TRINITY_DN48956_c0_g1_i1.p1  ORF type:complete len:424 (+),score=50.15 TRINITY_DN48956_c0_g1_i1:96-1367(+)